MKCFTSKATEILYGGSAGGGKSHTMRVAAIYYALAVPTIQIYLFRRLSDDLKKNHLDGSSGFISLLAGMLDSKHCKINYTTGQITFSNGSKIHLSHCQHEKDVIKYLGAELNILLIDELTHFTWDIYKYLRGRVRLGGLKVPKGLKGTLPRIICSSNPGGVGHEFVKSMFIDNLEPEALYQMPKEDGGMIRQFIPAKLADNPTMTENDPHYADKLIGLGGALAKAMLDGDWNAIEGAYFDTFDKKKHVIQPFIIPDAWTKIRAFDWGYSAPFGVLWGAVSDGSIIYVNGQPRVFPRDSIIIYREYYGTTGKPNEGLKLNANEIAHNILKYEENETIHTYFADPAIFSKGASGTGESIAELMQKMGCLWRPADNQRILGWQQVRFRLQGRDDEPLIYFFDSCKHLIRTIPIMQYDKTRAEDLDTKLEDHACFAANTLVDTDKGLIPIQDVNPLIHKIRIKGKWSNNYKAGMTRNNAKTIKLKFSNGIDIICTPNHKILDSTDTWRYAKDLIHAEVAWKYKSLVRVSKDRKKRIIIYVVITFKRKVLDCINWFGKILTGRCLKGILYIIKITTRVITGSIIWNALRTNNIIMSIEISLSNIHNKTLRRLKKQLSSGTKAKKVESGIESIGKIQWLKIWLKTLRKTAKYVTKSITRLKLPSIVVNTVTTTAKPVHCVSVEESQRQPVYCLNVPDERRFTIHEGLIVHNCDTLRYLCMARQITLDIPQTPSGAAEQWYKDFNPHNVLKQARQKKEENYE
jgi:hypothetical protein